MPNSIHPELARVQSRHPHLIGSRPAPYCIELGRETKKGVIIQGCGELGAPMPALGGTLNLNLSSPPHVSRMIAHGLGGSEVSAMQALKGLNHR